VTTTRAEIAPREARRRRRAAVRLGLGLGLVLSAGLVALWLWRTGALAPMAVYGAAPSGQRSAMIPSPDPRSPFYAGLAADFARLRETTAAPPPAAPAR
jgi:hypothetical protein